MAGLEVPDGGGRGGGRHLAGRDPLGTVEVHQSDEIPQYRGPAVILGRRPAQLHVLGSDLEIFHSHPEIFLIFLSRPRLA